MDAPGSKQRSAPRLRRLGSLPDAGRHGATVTGRLGTLPGAAHAASTRARARRMIGDRGNTMFMTRVHAYTVARTGTLAGVSHGNPYSRRATRGRIATVAVVGIAHSGRSASGIGGKKIIRMPSRAAGGICKPGAARRGLRSSPHREG